MIRLRTGTDDRHVGDGGHVSRHDAIAQPWGALATCVRIDSIDGSD